MRAALPTITALQEGGARIILMSHLGRPLKKKKKDGSLDIQKFTLRTTVDFAAGTIDADAQQKVESLQSGHILLLENTRFFKQEEDGNEMFARSLADLADYYVNDAFGTAHRAHASTTTVANFFTKKNKSFGLLMEKEIDNAAKILKSHESPFVCIIGGAKVSDKIGLIEKLLPVADTFIIGGAMAFTFIKAQGGQIGTSLVEDDKLDLARRLLQMANKHNTQLLLPVDATAADAFSEDARIETHNIDKLPDDMMGLDIGPASITKFEQALQGSKTILWNGPMGVFEMDKFAIGTEQIALSVAKATMQGAFSMIGGGDSVAAINKLNLSEQVSFVSTGGGAMLEFLEGKELPGIAAINK
ncbi:UNVERIFIED_CONTAM: hypothetical protein GTU68_024182 [Idotea baltica]|nr:hypothetical protein [Idotea baltica]